MGFARLLAGVDFLSSAGMFCDVVSISLLLLLLLMPLLLMFPPPRGVINGMEEGWFRLPLLMLLAVVAFVD